MDELESTSLNRFFRESRHVEALNLFARSSTRLVHDHHVFAMLLKSCTALRLVKSGRVIHSHVIKLGHVSCQYVSKGLLNMYAKCGLLDDSQKLFGQMEDCDTVVWNIVLSGFSVSRVDDTKVMRLFKKMCVVNNPKPTPVTIAIVLPVCARLKDLGLGRSVHSFAMKSGLETNTLVGDSLISMYAKCNQVLNDAYRAFASIYDKDVVSWNAIIAGFSENKMMDNAFSMFRQMLRGPVKPNYATFVTILHVLASMDKNIGFLLGKEIHCYVLRRTDLGEDISVCNALMSLYLKVGLMHEAETLFHRMNSRDLISWNAVIAGFVSNGQWLKALDLFHDLVTQEMIYPDSVTLISILPACAHLQNLLLGKAIHGYIFRNPYLFGETTVWNALVNFYAKCNNVKSAYHTFLLIPNRDLISWNSMLDAFVMGGHHTLFLDSFHRMLLEGNKPDSVTILSAGYFCSSVAKLEKVKEVHGYSIKFGFLSSDVDPAVGNSILAAYAKSGNMDYAFRVFQSLSKQRNLVTFNSMIHSYVNSGSHDDALKIFHEMSTTDITTWNLMVRACAENDCHDQALSFFHELQNQGFKPDCVTIMSILPLCTKLALVQMLRQCHGYIIRVCFNDVKLNGALLDVYAKCGSIDNAYKLFSSNHCKDLFMFTAMVGGYAMHGMGKEATFTFYNMLELGIKPDHVIITTVLSACSHAGLIDDGLKIFNSIEKVYKIKPTIEQYACVVDLLARGGRVKDAYLLVTKLPVEVSANLWRTLLGACKTHHEVELGCVVADRLFEIEASNIGNYVVMSNLYAADARWDQVMEMRKLMRTKDLKKPAGCSWIEVNRQNNVFIAADSSHTERIHIYSMLSILDQQMKELFQFD
ncbi:hypothetical protein ACFE04_015836 [Oxalis oulophora]